MMNSLRRKPRARPPTSRPSLLSYHAGDVLPDRGDDGGLVYNGTQEMDVVGGAMHYNNYQPDVNYGVQPQSQQQQYYAEYTRSNIPRYVPLSRSSKQFNLPLTQHNGNKIREPSYKKKPQQPQARVENLRYNVHQNMKGNQYNVSQVDRAYQMQSYHNPHYQQYQPQPDRNSAKKSRYEVDYNETENLLSHKPIAGMQSQLGNEQYSNHRNLPQQDTRSDQSMNQNYYISNNSSPTYNKDNIVDGLPQRNYADLDAVSSNTNSINTNSSSTNSSYRELAKRRSLTPSVTKQPSFRSHQYSNNNSAISSTSVAPNRTVEGVVKRRKHMVLLGLDGAGKTTILMRLKYRCYMATTPTVGFNHEKVWGGGFRWSVWDIGGGERLRPLWGTYSRGTDCVVFVVDAAGNSDTMEEARLELARIMKLTKTTATQMKKQAPPLLVMANFQDQSSARNAPEVAKCLSLQQEGAGAVAASWAVACVCGVTGEGLDEALATLRHLIDNGPSNNKTKSRAKDIWR